jgi:dienelactone hydrolase
MRQRAASLMLPFALAVMLVSALSAQPADGPPFYHDKADLLYIIDEEGRRTPIETADGWARRRAHILANMQLVMGPVPDESQRVALDVREIGEYETEDFVRRRITFAVEPDDRVPAYLFIPKSLPEPRPAMLCLHQTTAIGKGEPADISGDSRLPYARELAERGYVTLAPDYPGYGDYKIDVYERGYVSATMKGIWNHMRAVDLLQSLPEVDPDRIGVIGHSLGGHNSLFVAVFDERLKVVVTSCGFNSFFKYYGGDLTGWSHNGYMPRIASLYDRDPAKMPFDFTEVLGAIAPRAVFINAPTGDSNFEISGVHDCLNAAWPVYELLGAAENLTAVHPDCGHGFPLEVREQAYAFVDRVLQPGRPTNQQQ